MLTHCRSNRLWILGAVVGLGLTVPAFPQGAVPEGLSFYEQFEFNRIFSVREDRPQVQTAAKPDSKKELIVRPAVEPVAESTKVSDFTEKAPAPQAAPAEKPAEAPRFVPAAAPAELAAAPGILVLYGKGGMEFIESEKKHVNIPYKSVTGMFYEYTARPAWLGPAPEPVEEKKGWKQKIFSLVKFEGTNPRYYLTIRYVTETGPDVLILRIDHPERDYLISAIETKTGRRADRTRSGVMLASASRE
ncbi:MAG: hypothetical protein U0Q16_17455 [Bryobacteraceae bacterium]